MHFLSHILFFICINNIHFNVYPCQAQLPPGFICMKRVCAYASFYSMGTKVAYRRFLSVRPRVCLQLPSDSASRWTPLPLAKSSRYRATSGLSPYRTCAHRAHSKRRRLVRVSAWCLLAPKGLACQSLASYNAHGVRLPSARRNVLSHCRATSGSCVTITTALCSS